MSGNVKQFEDVHAAVKAQLGSSQRNTEMKEYKRGYFSMVVAMVLARARRECDDTEDITAAVANCHISNPPRSAIPRQGNPFKY